MSITLEQRGRLPVQPIKYVDRTEVLDQLGLIEPSIDTAGLAELRKRRQQIAGEMDEAYRERAQLLVEDSRDAFDIGMVELDEFEMSEMPVQYSQNGSRRKKADGDKPAGLGGQRWERRQGPEWTGGYINTGNWQNDARRRYPRNKLRLQPDKHSGMNGSVDSRSDKLDNDTSRDNGNVKVRYRGIAELVEGLVASRVMSSDRPMRDERAVKAGKADAAPARPLRTRRVIPV